MLDKCKIKAYNLDCKDNLLYSKEFDMEKDLEFIELFEIYKGLLTQKQRELFSSRYLYDLTLTEIAEEDGGSRQNVFDAVKKVKAKLVEYEKVLGLREKYGQIKDLTKDNCNRELHEKILDIIGI